MSSLTGSRAKVPPLFADSAAIRAGYRVTAGQLRMWAHRGWVRTMRVGSRVVYDIEGVEQHAEKIPYELRS